MRSAHPAGTNSPDHVPSVPRDRPDVCAYFHLPLQEQVMDASVSHDPTAGHARRSRVPVSPAQGFLLLILL
ncbi:MAG: hypothetical protein M3O70_06970 [Actinomycetota bacterium]|nr:hypothetical protein [Actinomycetota bacterium]